MHEPFVGRTGELAELDRQLASAEGGHGNVVLLTGAPGAGKTALIRRCESAWAARASVVWASGDPEEAAITGGLLSQLTRFDSAAAADLAAVLASGRADPLTAGSALLALLTGLASPRPLVVAVDDAQWGDELSLKALSFALRRLRGDPVLCVVAVRPDGLTRLPSGMTRAVAEHGARLDLGGLQTGEVAALAKLTGAGRLTERAASRLRDHTGGLALHIKELLHDLPGQSLRTPGVTLPAPRSLETLVLARLAGCALDTERLVVAAAILGGECELADAAALAGLADPLPALQEAIERRLLSEPYRAGYRRCSFPHALIGTAIYRDIGISRRAALHRAAAELSHGCAALAHRAAGCRGSDPELAQDLAAQAAREQAAGQLAEAAEHLLMAARAGRRGADRDRWLLSAVAMLIDLGDAARARAHADEIAALAPSAERSLLLGRLSLLSGAYGPAEHLITEALASLQAAAGPGPEQMRNSAANTACELALMLIGQHRLDDAAAWARRATDTAASGFIRACSCAIRGVSLATAGQAIQARALLEAELLRCADAAGRTLLCAGLGAALLYADDLPGAARHVEAALSADGDASLPMAHLLQARLLRVLVCYRSGEWDEASAEGEHLVTLVDDLDQGWLLGRAHLAAVYAAAGRGRWAAAAAHAEAAARQPGAAAATIELADARAAIAVARDDPEGVIAAAQGAISDLDLLCTLEPGRLSFWPAYAQALARTGRADDADIIVRRYEERARACGRPSAMAAACRARGIVEAARDRPDEALTALEASLGHLAGLGIVMEEAMTRLERGRLLRRVGQRRSAARDIGAARSLFAGLGAQPFLARCDQELLAEQGTAAGSRQPPLTVRQLAVARAAAAGKSNREIATELYISVKTVEFHLGQILARLCLDSRTQIAGALAQGPADRAL